MENPATIRLSASDTLTLGQGGDRVLRVDRGGVELFLVWESAVMQGRRHHFASLPEGSWLFDCGFGFRDHGVSVLVVGQADTVATVLDPAAQPPAISAQKLDDWVALIESWMTEVLPDRGARTHQFTGGETPVLAAGDTASARGTWWWQMPAAEALFFGVKIVDVKFVPLAADGWLVCRAGAPASRALTSREILSRPDGLDEVARAHDLFLRTIQAGIVARGEMELHARERRSQWRDAAADNAWGDIAAVLAGEQVGVSSRPSVIAAFATVARRQGIEPRIPSDLPADGTSRDLLAALVRRSSIRLRRVTLEGEWFRRDHGPLIGFLPDGEAVALLPEKGRTILQKADGSRAWVQAGTALDPSAYFLYRTLPDRKLTLRDIVDFSLWHNGPDLRLLVMTVFLTGIFGLVLPLMMGPIFDFAVPQGERGLMIQIGAALMGAVVVKAALELARGMAVIRIQSRTDLHLQAAVWDRLLKLPARFFRGFTSGDLALRAQGITEMHEVISSAGTMALFALPVGLFNFLVMFQQSRVLAMWGLALALLALGVSLVLSACRVLILRRQYDLGGKLAGLVFQLINGVAKFRVAGGEHLAFATWARDYARQERQAVSAGRWGLASRTFFAGYALLASALIFAVVARLDSLSLGAFLAFSVAFGGLTASLILVGESSLPLLRLFPLFARTKPIFEAEPETSVGRLPSGPLTGEVEMANVTFRYAPDLPPVLEDFSLQVNPGEFVALVGPSGSGKSTILRLLLGLEVPENGAIFYDRKDLRSLDLRDVRAQIGSVLPRPGLVAGDIFRNIVGESSLTLEDAWRAAEQAGLAADIRAMPMQMDTAVGEGGGSFSGGQRQRLAIARALVRRPRMVYLDEATSALDNRTQAVVAQSLEQSKATRVVIAHRLSTIRRADRIVVVRDGRVVEQGRYEELMKGKGFFHELAAMQLV